MIAPDCLPAAPAEPAGRFPFSGVTSNRMFYNNLLCFLVAIFVFSASNPPEKPWLPPVVALALLLASLWLFAAVAGRQSAAAASAGRYFAPSGGCRSWRWACSWSWWACST